MCIRDRLFLDTGRDKRFLVAGVDEAGRGPLAGSVVAAAVILDPEQKIAGLADSKVLTEERREELALQIRERSVCWCVAEASVEEIDKLNILHASMLAMARAIEGLSQVPNHCLIDGNRCPITQYNCQAIVKGDSLVQEISAASMPRSRVIRACASYIRCTRSTDSIDTKDTRQGNTGRHWSILVHSIFTVAVSDP